MSNASTHKGQAGARRRVANVVRVLFAGAVLILVVSGVVLAWFVYRAWPKVSGRIAVSGLQAPVEVISDRWGIPHIYAQNEHDLFFTQGYVHARDRMWQLEFARRLAGGTLSEILGPDAIRFDRLTRTVGLRRGAEHDWENMQGESRAVVIAYADGVNAFLNANRGRLSLEFSIFQVDPRPWTPLDTLLISKLMCWILSENASIEISRARILARAGASAAAELLPPYSEGLPVIVPASTDRFTWLPPAEGLKNVASLLGTGGPTQGSNSWVLAGSLTNTGRPLLANDTHLNLFLPSVWYANDLHGGGLDVEGYSLAGTPAVVIGHNKRIAWGVTDLVADVQDFYIEKVDNIRDPKSYEFQGKWIPLQIASETIPVKGRPAVVIQVARTRHGPLVSQTLSPFEDNRPLSLAWAGEDSRGVVTSEILINRATNWYEFRQGVSQWDGPDINYVFADIDGNIGYQAAGHIPWRAPGHLGVIPVPGWTGEFDWRGFIPFDALPTQLNPERGFVVTANQKPTGSNYQYLLGYEFADQFRAERITHLLSDRKLFDVQDMEAIQGDTYDGAAEVLRPFLLTLHASSDTERAALNEVRNWDLRSDVDSGAPAIYQAWYRFLVQDTVEDELGPELTSEYMEYYWVHIRAMVQLMRQGNSRLFDDIRTPQIENRDAIVQRSFRDALAWLEKHDGPDVAQWHWSSLHTLTFRHHPFGMTHVPVLSRLFNYGPIVAPGFDRFTVNAAWFTTDNPDKPFAVDAGAAQRLVADTADWDRSVAVNSTGQTEQLFHRHRDDQIRMWAAMKYHPLLFSRAKVEAAAEGRLNLIPVGTSGPRE